MPANAWDGAAAQIVPSAVERLPLYHWHPGRRVLVVGSRDGVGFDDQIDAAETGSFQRRLDPDLLATAIARTGVTGLCAAWHASLFHPISLRLLRDVADAAHVPLIVATPGLGDPALLDEILPSVDAWLLAVDHEPAPLAPAILDRGRHVEVLVGMDGRTLPDLPWQRARAVHVVARRPAADPDLRRTWYASARAVLQLAAPVYDEDHPHTDCRSCGERLVWRSGGRSRLDAVDAQGCCNHCGASAGLTR